LRDLSRLTYEEFVQDEIVQAAVEHSLQVAIQAALDIGSMILAERALKAPESYRDVFARLAEIGVLPDDFARRITPMAQFRNVLVHLYVEVDLDRVYAYLRNNLDDLETYARYVGRYLNK
jgi:uncharacterized protein YutE (UPF0331/DUF86 family)